MAGSHVANQDSHLVLGGSEGIGFSYASYYAKQHHDFVLVARRKEKLECAAADLYRLGASSVRTVPGDVVDRKFRSRLFQDLGAVGNVFIGGPTIPYGTIGQIQETEAGMRWEEICRAGLIYPLEVLRWSLSQGCLRGGRTLVLGSSSSKGQLLTTKFFLSAFFRYGIDRIVSEMEIEFASKGLFVDVLRPELVITPLSMRFAKQISKTDDEKNALEFLKKYLNLSKADSSDEFVLRELSKIDRELD